MVSESSTTVARRSLEQDVDQELDADVAIGQSDDSDHSLLLEKARSDACDPSYRYKKSRTATSRNSPTRRPLIMSRRARYLRLSAFVFVELSWLVFAILAGFNSIFVTNSVRSNMKFPGGLTVNRDALLKSGLSSLAIIVQLVAFFPVTDIIVEFYSGEWAYVLAREGGQLTSKTDRVSTLTSSFMDRLAHMFDKHSSKRYRTTFIIALLSLALQTIAPGAITISLDTREVDGTLTIGALQAGKTDPTGRFHIDNDFYTEINQNTQTLLARKLLLDATRYEYVAWINNSTLDYNTDSETLLYGMPPRGLIELGFEFGYVSDAVRFQFECQWLAPTYLHGNLTHSNWTFGGDMEGSLDYNAIPVSGNPEWVAGIWPLMITAGSGASNGSFAWLFIGTATESDAHTSHKPMDISSIDPIQRTYNSSGWWDTVNYTGASNEDLYLRRTESTDASILFCDPHMEIISVQVSLDGQNFSADPIPDMYDVSVGNIDRGEASRMLGRCLNGMPFDSVQYERSGLSLTAGLSEIAVKFALQPTITEDGREALPLLPRPLSNLTKSLQSYVHIAGANAYLDGSVGTIQVPAQKFEPAQRLFCSLPQWCASFVLFFAVFLLLFGVITFEGPRPVNLVPLTLASVMAAIDSGEPGIARKRVRSKSFT